MATRIALARTKLPSRVPSARALAAMIRCGQRLATTLGPTAASPLPLLPGLRPTQSVCEPLPQLLQGDRASIHRFQESETLGNDQQETSVRFAACIGGRRLAAPPTLAHPVSLRGSLESGLAAGRKHD